MRLRWILFFAIATTMVAGNREEIFDQDLYQNVLDAELCRQQLENMRPFQFYDASFRVPHGILTGSTSSLGEYSQCLQIRQESASGPIEGKYCMISLRGEDTFNVPLFSGNSWPRHLGWSEFNTTETLNQLKKSVSSKLDHILGAEKTAWRKSRILGSTRLSLALCIPKACSVGDVLDPVINNSLVPFAYTEQFCRLPVDKPFSGADYTAIGILSILGLFTVLSTGYDLHHTFILKEGHTHINYLLQLHTGNLSEFFEWFSKKRAIWLLSADVSVDTFFTLSGLLLVYVSVNKLNQKKLLRSIHWFYLNRLLRVFPLLALGVLLQASLFFRVTDGPNWWNLAKEVSQCRQYWWSAFLHVQNWVNPQEKCLEQTWYLSVDMQLHLASPILLYWVLGSRRSAWTSLSVGLVTALAAIMVYYIFKDFSDSLYGNDYHHTLMRTPPFIIGMACGYILTIVRGSKVRMTRPVVVVCYVLAFVGSSYAMYQAYPEWSSPVVRNLNYSLVRALWALSVCWLVFACVCGYGGPINWFLSLTLWKFMARISYAMYIFHYPVMFMHGGSLTMPFYYSMENMWFTFAGVTLYTVVVSVAASVLVDAPCSTLLKLMISGNFSKTPANPQTDSKKPVGDPVQTKQDARIESTHETS